MIYKRKMGEIVTDDIKEENEMTENVERSGKK